jgi:hypothetical protein
MYYLYNYPSDLKPFKEGYVYINDNFIEIAVRAISGNFKDLSELEHLFNANLSLKTLERVENRLLSSFFCYKLYYYNLGGLVKKKDMVNKFLGYGSNLIFEKKFNNLVKTNIQKTTILKPQGIL